MSDSLPAPRREAWPMPSVPSSPIFPESQPRISPVMPRFWNKVLIRYFLHQVSKALQGKFETEVTLRQLIGPALQHRRDGRPSRCLSTGQCLRGRPPTVSIPAPTANAGVPAALPALVAPVVAPAQGSLIESVISQQLELMRRQITLLQGGAVPSPVSAPPVVIHRSPRYREDQDSPKVATIRRLRSDNGDQPEPRRQPDRPSASAPRRARRKYAAKTRASKELTAKSRQWYADPRTVSGFNRRWKEMIYQIAVQRSKGSRLIDVDGNEIYRFAERVRADFLGHSPDFITKALHAQLDRGVEVGPRMSPPWRRPNCFARSQGMNAPVS